MMRTDRFVDDTNALTFSPAWLEALFADAGRVWVGLSGGVDSCVLLHALVNQVSPLQRQQLTAIHIHHGLSAKADEWIEFCQQLCQDWGVGFVAEKVCLQTQASIEDAARKARYEVFEQHVSSKDVLLLAHHQGDQTETVLFRLLRGTGGKGLSGMPVERALGETGARLLRPLLSVSKAQIENYAERFALSWVQDDSNFDEHFTRNFLRQSVIPPLVSRFPKMQENIASTAQRIETDYTMLARFAEQQLASWCNPKGGLILTELAELAAEERQFWLRHFLAQHDISLPHRQLVNLDTMLTSAGDKQPEVLLAEKRLQRHQHCLYVLPQESPVVLGKLIEGQWLTRSFDSVRVLGAVNCELKPRPQGASITLANGNTRKLKKWLNDQSIPSWWRDHLPYIYQDNQLVAIGDLWVHPDWQGKVEWQPSPQLPI
ncbi:tRNA lysidine(34) synthetase TilS [Marinomonas dokdonensis]|uniref:tRNA lysidine(34) synthetase TilS n=1 Tax=Marinomonas dokdonensis TaxID=328224 RepID=UPI00405546C4